MKKQLESGDNPLNANLETVLPGLQSVLVHQADSIRGFKSDMAAGFEEVQQEIEWQFKAMKQDQVERDKLQAAMYQHLALRGSPLKKAATAVAATSLAGGCDEATGPSQSPPEKQATDWKNVFPKPKFLSLRNSVSSREPSRAAESSARVALIGMREPVP